jgi:hypothetical protein
MTPGRFSRGGDQTNRQSLHFRTLTHITRRLISKRTHFKDK